MIKDKIIIAFSKRFPTLFFYLSGLKQILFPIRGKKNTIIKRGCVINSKISIVGNNNKIVIAPGCILKNVEFHVRGDNHIIQIEENCKVREWASIWCEGEGNTVLIGRETTIVSAHLCAQEMSTQIIIGKDCMISNNVQIRTSDSHPYYEIENRKRLNEARSVCIKDHVWICAKASILKGVTVGCGSVIGYSSIVTKNVLSNTLVAGIPAKIIKENIYWNRKIGDVVPVCFD